MHALPRAADTVCGTGIFFILVKREHKQHWQCWLIICYVYTIEAKNKLLPKVAFK